MVVLAFVESFAISFLPKTVDVVGQHVVLSVGRSPVRGCFVVHLSCCGRKVLRESSAMVVEVFFG